MTDMTELKPCARGCLRKGTEATEHPEVLAARHGRYCDRCYYRTDKALRGAAVLVEHIITLIAGIQSKQDDGSQRTKKHPPLPFNVEAFNDANETYARLVYWTSLWATRLGRVAPAPAMRAWRVENNSIVGLPSDISPGAARYAVSVMGTWLSIHLTDICSLTMMQDDIDYFHDEFKDLYRVAARWPMEDHPQYVPVVCWIDDCGAKIALHPPKFLGDDQLIVCDRGHVFQQDEYDRQASLFREVRTEQAKEALKAKKRADRLAGKYGAA